MTAASHDALVRALPYARRYARALTGSQGRGDGLVAAALKELLARGAEAADPRLLLYACVTRQFDGPNAPDDGGRGLSGRQRQLLLLTSLEGLSVEAAARVLTMEQEGARAELTDARSRLRAAAATDVLIIEDEPIIAMDIEELVQNCGHRVIGVASTEREAVEIAGRARPGLILADINLGAGGDGAMAVSRILQSHPAPVIFVTAYPERLLTGEEVEPAFVITKPFEPMTLAVATYQAVTGGVHLD